MNWQDVLWSECKKAYQKGGEIKAIFIRRGKKFPAAAFLFYDKTSAINRGKG